MVKHWSDRGRGALGTISDSLGDGGRVQAHERAFRR